MFLEWDRNRKFRCWRHFMDGGAMGGWAGYILSRRVGCAAGSMDWLAACFPWGGGGWLAGCAVRAASPVVGVVGLWVWLRSDVPNFLSLLFFLFFFLCRQSPLSRFRTREATLTYRMFK